MRKVLLYFAIKYNGDYKKMLQAIKEKESVPQSELDSVEYMIKSNYITMLDPEYPVCFKHMAVPPIVLFYYGDISLLKSLNSIGVIGTRENSSYGEYMTKKIVNELKDYKVTLISGMAKGIDGIAHLQALDKKIPTIAVLGGGIDYIYPPSNIDIYKRIKKEGLIISEYPNDIEPQPQNFLIRNRLIASLSNNILVIEANMKSGTMNTVAYALEMGKDVYCVPERGNICSGCNYLIKQGAKLVESASDIYE